MLTRLGSKLAGWSPLRCGTPAEPIDLIRTAWPDIVGADVAAHCRPERLASATLAIVTHSSAWSQQLALLSEKIIDGVDRVCGAGSVARLRFRVGRASLGAQRGAGLVPARAPHAHVPQSEPADSLADALARLRARIEGAQRAKRRAGTKFCSDCQAALEQGTRCAPCEGAEAAERRRAVEQLAYEAPWLGYAGIAELVPGLTRPQYDAIRLQALQRWWSELQTIVRGKRRAPSERERLLASSFVLLKTELAPDAVREAVLRNELGDDLHDILYGQREKS